MIAYLGPDSDSGSTRSPLRGNFSSLFSSPGTGGSRTSSWDGGVGFSGSRGVVGLGCMTRTMRRFRHLRHSINSREAVGKRAEAERVAHRLVVPSAPLSDAVSEQ
jgi:hypothetical protein